MSSKVYINFGETWKSNKEEKYAKKNNKDDAHLTWELIAKANEDGSFKVNIE